MIVTRNLNRRAIAETSFVACILSTGVSIVTFDGDPDTDSDLTRVIDCARVIIIAIAVVQHFIDAPTLP